VSNQRAEIREKRRCAHVRSTTQGSVIPECRAQADPISVQLGVRLTRCAPLCMKELVQIEHSIPFPHVVDSARQFMGQDR
jgi:hypothetical protein